MSFDSTKLAQQSQFCMVNNELPGLFAYISTTDNLATILTNGYFSSATWVDENDFVEIAGTDGAVLRVFDSNRNLINPFASQSLSVSAITSNSANLAVETFYIFNITGIGNYTLPSASGNAGKRIYLKQVSALGSCNINAAGGQTVISLSALSNKGTVISDGTNWFDIG